LDKWQIYPKDIFCERAELAFGEAAKKHLGFGESLPSEKVEMATGKSVLFNRLNKSLILVKL